MLSRRHIRVKVLQTLYMHYNEGQDQQSLQQLTKVLDKNITKLYELYLYLLLFLEEVGTFARQYDEETKTRYIQDKDMKTSLILYQNPVLQKLILSDSFHKATTKYKVMWTGDTDLVRRIFFDLKNQEIYKEYFQFSDQNPVLNQEILIFILKHYTTNQPLLAQHLEEEYYNWLDDRKIVMQMASKTIQMLAVEQDKEDFMQPIGPNADELFEFAQDLLKKTIEFDSRFNEIISTRITKWEPHQVALIDNIILKMAVCEFLYFPSIPSTVSINEYIELAKTYSTPQSKKFVNGVLDAILKELKTEGVVLKN